MFAMSEPVWKSCFHLSLCTLISLQKNKNHLKWTEKQCFQNWRRFIHFHKTQSLNLHNKYNAGNVVISVDLDPSVLLLAFVPHILCDETVQFLHVVVSTANWLSTSKWQGYLVILLGEGEKSSSWCIFMTSINWVCQPKNCWFAAAL